MRKEAINTFQEGLNYDLNPITTPNNVLTDCINGTFVTFNGDELALQNDAGNTKILIPGTTEYVKLSPGFYPIGIKEYGGVIYIISGRKIQLSEDIEDWVPNQSYAQGTIVRYNNKYYINELENNTNSIINSELMLEELNSGILITETNEFILSENGWTATIIDSQNYANSIEFGSYPSPEFSGTTQNLGITYAPKKLYDPVIINNSEFKSGRYTLFPTSEFTSTNFSYQNSSGNYIKRLYKVKLWHQLNNGLLDLTDDVMSKYQKFRGSQVLPSDYWFIQPNFPYFCPNQFKGKLAMSVELEPIDTFKLKEVSSVKFTGTNYELSLKVGVSYLSTIASIPSVKVKILIGTTEYTSAEFSVVNNEASILFTLDKNTYDSKVIRYEVTPNFFISGVNEYDSLPSEFKNNYIIKGERLLTSSEASVVFELVNGGCDINNYGWYSYSAAILKNSLGQYINKDLEYSATPYAFMLSGYTNSEYTSVGTYTLNIGAATGTPIVSTEGLTVSDAIAQLFSTSIITFSSEECRQVTLTINTNEELQSVSNFSITQGNKTIVPTMVNSKQFTCGVSLNSAVNIIITKPGFLREQASITVNSATTINLALIASLRLETWSTGDTVMYEQYAYWDYYTPDITDISVSGNNGFNTVLIGDPVLNPTIYAGSDIVKNDLAMVTISILSGDVLSATNYLNISSPALFKVINGHIFNKTYYLDWEFRGDKN